MATSTTTNPSSTTAPATAGPSTGVAGAASATTPITNTAASGTHGRKIDVQGAYQALITGLNAAYQPTDVFALKTGSMTRDDVTAQLNQVIVAAETTKTAQAAFRSAVANERNVQAQMQPIRSGLRGIIQARFGADDPSVTQFGFMPRRPTKKTAISKATAAAKAQATRTARGTKGKNQKADIHGSATVTVTQDQPAPTGTGTASNAVAPSGATASSVAAPAVGTAAPVTSGH